MSSDESNESGKIAIALRIGRAAIGWNQSEFAEKLGVAKSTIARIETLEMAPKAELVMRAMRLFRESGVDIDLYLETEVKLAISPTGLVMAIARIQEETFKRKDRARGIMAILPPESDI
jgi:transcriptional regulator with XRE-family HTH domain